MMTGPSRRPPLRFIALALAYLGVLAASLAFSLLLRFDFDVPTGYWQDWWRSALWILPLKIILLAATGQFRSLLTFFGLPDAMRLAWAMGIAGALAIGVWFAAGGAGVLPRGVIVTDMVVSFASLVALRTAMRIYREKGSGRPSDSPGKRTLIVGAGLSGSVLLKDIEAKPGLGIEVVAFLDDDPDKIGGTLHTKPVLGPVTGLSDIARRLDIAKVIIAMPSATPSKLKETVAAANEALLEHDILPSVGQLLERRVTVNRLRPVEPEDLLGRPAVGLDDAGIASLLGGSSVLVTGAGGSIGAELCRQIAAKAPAKLVLVERSEAALFAIHEELRADFPALSLVPLAADVTNEEAMQRIFREHRPRVVLHAAAHKHVPLMEEQPLEAYRNNVLGTAVATRAAAAHGTERFVLISTDKAVNPAGVMGATKRLAEKLTHACQATGGGCVFSAVRFGNVLGSSGSVVPVFHRQISGGGPVTVTDPGATRFFMTIPEAAGLILQSALLAEGGETFLLEMGAPVKIEDLARQMIELAGFVPGRDIDIRYTGLRPGERLHEETTAPGEQLRPTTHPYVRQVTGDEHGGFDESSALRLFEELLAEPPERGRKIVLTAARKPHDSSAGHLCVVEVA